MRSPSANSRSRSANSSAASNVLNHDKIIEQYIVNFELAIDSATNIPNVDPKAESSAFGREYALEKDFVSNLVDLNIAPELLLLGVHIFCFVCSSKST